MFLCLFLNCFVDPPCIMGNRISGSGFDVAHSSYSKVGILVTAFTWFKHLIFRGEFFLNQSLSHKYIL